MTLIDYSITPDAEYRNSVVRKRSFRDAWGCFLNLAPHQHLQGAAVRDDGVSHRERNHA